jgi:hypothetical protein
LPSAVRGWGRPGAQQSSRKNLFSSPNPRTAFSFRKLSTTRVLDFPNAAVRIGFGKSSRAMSFPAPCLGRRRAIRTAPHGENEQRRSCELRSADRPPRDLATPTTIAVLPSTSRTIRRGAPSVRVAPAPGRGDLVDVCGDDCFSDDLCAVGVGSVAWGVQGGGRHEGLSGHGDRGSPKCKFHCAPDAVRVRRPVARARPRALLEREVHAPRRAPARAREVSAAG